MIQTPVTVVAGEQGAGKTHAIVELIQAHPGKRFAVLVNRTDRDMDDVEQISKAGGRCLPVLGGCICCTLADAFVGAMLQITAVRDLYDHILIEACHEADPAKIMEFAHADPELEPRKIIFATLSKDTEISPLARDADLILNKGTTTNYHDLIV